MGDSNKHKRQKKQDQPEKKDALVCLPHTLTPFCVQEIFWETELGGGLQSNIVNRAAVGVRGLCFTFGFLTARPGADARF